MQASLSEGPSLGEVAPFCYGLTAQKTFYSFQTQAGRPSILVLADQITSIGLGQFVTRLSKQADLLAACDIVVIVKQACEDLLRHDLSDFHAATVVACYAQDFFPRLRIEPSKVVSLVLDRNLRIVDRLDGSEECAAVAAAQAVAALPTEEPRDIKLPAPILMLHGLIDKALCRELITRFESGTHFDSGMATVDVTGTASYKIDHDKKRRRDHLLQPGDPLHDRLHEILLTRCGEEIRKAFQIDIAFIDRLLIARYDDDGGHFRRHRDNGARGVAFRQFALSLNLNAEDYDGGYLRFPEYNSHRYSPPTGTGLIFSASLLHEVAPVMRGRRYVLLTFLHDRTAEMRRLADLAQDIQPSISDAADAGAAFRA